MWPRFALLLCLPALVHAQCAPVTNAVSSVTSTNTNWYDVDGMPTTCGGNMMPIFTYYAYRTAIMVNVSGILTQNATVTSAVLSFEAANINLNPLGDWWVFAETSLHPEDCTADTNLFHRNYTTTHATWTPPQWAVAITYNSTDIAPVLNDLLANLTEIPEMIVLMLRRSEEYGPNENVAWRTFETYPSSPPFITISTECPQTPTTTVSTTTGGQASTGSQLLTTTTSGSTAGSGSSTSGSGSLSSTSASGSGSLSSTSASGSGSLSSTSTSGSGSLSSTSTSGSGSLSSTSASGYTTGSSTSASGSSTTGCTSGSSTNCTCGNTITTTTTTTTITTGGKLPSTGALAKHSQAVAFTAGAAVGILAALIIFGSLVLLRKLYGPKKNADVKVWDV